MVIISTILKLSKSLNIQQQQKIFSGGWYFKMNIWDHEPALCQLFREIFANYTLSNWQCQCQMPWREQRMSMSMPAGESIYSHQV